MKKLKRVEEVSWTEHLKSASLLLERVADALEGIAGNVRKVQDLIGYVIEMGKK